jgi:metal-dependent amidase/aminoacylase/carboxypeptidase family protein
VREGVLGDKVAAVVAVHVHPDLPWGAVSVEPGAVNASSDILRIVIEGRSH